MFNWDSILMVINYMFCNDKLIYFWVGIGKYFFGGSWVNILLDELYMLISILDFFFFVFFNDKRGKEERVWDYGWLYVFF